MPDINKKIEQFEWKHWLERPYGIFISTLIYSGASQKYFKNVGLPGFGYYANLYQYPNIYFSEKIVLENQKILNRYFKNHNIFDVSNALQKSHQQNIKKTHKIINDKSLLAEEKLSEVREILRSYYPFLYFILNLEKYYNDRIAKEVPPFIKTDINKFIGDTSVPRKKNAYSGMLAMLESGKPLELVKKKYSWLKSRDGFTDTYTIAELKEIKRNIKIENKARVAIPEPLKGLCDELKELVYFRTDRTDKYYETLALSQEVFKEVAGHLNISFRELENYDAESIINGHPKKFDKPYSYFHLNGEIIIKKGQFIKFSKILNTEVRGTSAFDGKVQGRVKIVHNPKEINKVNPGDILVTQMTFPAFISAMQKAAAFITDEGGITCHAAIIAREMKKPCIVGTKIATKVLKDGDMVEVDAERGVVTIIKKQ
jgi:phosphohistidine swiveling domain-containing protein